MIKINGREGSIDIAGGVNEITAELSIVMYEFSNAYAKSKGITLNEAISYISNIVNENVQKQLSKNAQGGKQ